MKNGRWLMVLGLLAAAAAGPAAAQDPGLYVGGSLGGGSTGEDDIDVFSLGVLVRF